MTLIHSDERLTLETSVFESFTVANLPAKFPHSPILHYACGSVYIVLYFSTKKQQKQRIVPQLTHSFCHYFPLTMTYMHNEVWGCAEI